MRPNSPVLERILAVRYTTRDGNGWHSALITVDEWRTIHRTGRCGGLTFCAIHAEGSDLIRDFILEVNGFRKPCYRLRGTNAIC